MFWGIQCLLLQIRKFPERYIIRSSSILVPLSLQSSLKLQEIEWWCFLECLEVGLTLHLLYFRVLPTSNYLSLPQQKCFECWVLFPNQFSLLWATPRHSSFFTLLQWLELALTLPIYISFFKGKVRRECSGRVTSAETGLIFVAILSFAVLMVFLKVR